MIRFLVLWSATSLLTAQLSQNPSPMVEHTRPHTRLVEQSPPGQRYPLEIGNLYVPPKLDAKKTLLVFFHGGTWLPEVAAAKNKFAVISVQAGQGSGTYASAFADPKRLPNLIAEAQSKSGRQFKRTILGGWSAGCGAIRELLRTPSIYENTSAVLCIDGMHAGYPTGKPGPLESQLEPANIEIWTKLAHDAIARKKLFIVTHSEIFPGTFASTTETADYLVQQLELKLRPVLKPGPMGTQQLGEVRSGNFRLLGFAGNSAPDHVDQLHSLPEYLKWPR